MAGNNNNRGAVWSEKEKLDLISIWKEEDVEAQLRVVHRNLPIYQRVAELHNLRGYERTPEQCRNKMKSLKSDYNKDKKLNVGHYAEHKFRPFFPFLSSSILRTNNVVYNFRNGALFCTSRKESDSSSFHQQTAGRYIVLCVNTLIRIECELRWR